MLSRAISGSAIASLSLIVLLVVQVNAAPSMGIGSKANYSLSLKFSTTQSCNASPVLYNQTACGPPVPRSFVSIIDSNGTCVLNVATCYFAPPSITISPGTTLIWTNEGQAVHAVASCDANNSPSMSACPAMDATGLASFNSGPSGLATGQSFSFTFSASAVYYYFDPIHPWMHGSVNVSLAAPPAPVSTQVTPPPITVSGNVGWTVVGLDANTAVLNVTHSLSVFVDNIPIAPVSESGSFQSSINLSTRAESHGTAIETIDNFALPIIALLVAGTSSSSGITPFTAADSFSSSLPTMYTMWWVNGPLSNGSPVQLLVGYSSVQGDETAHLPGVGDRSAWIVTSNVAEDLSAFAPQLGSPSSGASINSANARLALKFDYDKSSDLLLSSSDSAIITATSAGVFQPGQTLCGSSGLCVQVSSLTTVTHVMKISASASLTLSSTNLNLGKRDAGSGPGSDNSMLSALQAAMSQPVVITLAGAAAAAIASVVVWMTKRQNRGQASIPEAAHAPTASPK